MNILLSNTLLKILVGLYEQLTYYENIASKITDRSKTSIGKDVYNVHKFVNFELKERIEYSSFWYVDKNTIEVTDKESNLYQQISVYSQLTQSLYSVYYSMKDTLLNIFLAIIALPSCGGTLSEKMQVYWRLMQNMEPWLVHCAITAKKLLPQIVLFLRPS